MTTPHLHKSRRMVIKIGSLLVADSRTGIVKQDWMNALAEDIVALRNQQIEVILVSSGAVALGRTVLKLGTGILKLEEKQAAAACGQIRLAETWQQAFRPHQLSVAQILLTSEDTEQRRRYLNARTTLNTLLGFGIIPVINENDSITTAEIRYGDNDRLAARVAAMASCDTLVLLSDIDGLYTADPKLHPDAKFIPLVDKLTPEIQAMAGETRDNRSSGGMKTKLMAAAIATSSGCHMVIADGRIEHPLEQIATTGRCTWFLAKETPLNARKHWIANSVHVTGTLIVDDGAVRALGKGHSLLPAGVVAVEGQFERGDTVRVRDRDGKEIAHGLAAYPSDEAQRILGRQSDAIEQILGYKSGDELVHRDDLVMSL